MQKLSLAQIVGGLLGAVMCLGLQAQGQFEARIASIEQVMNRFYRGERLEKAVDRSNEEIRAYNDHALARQAETDKERAKLEEMMAPIEKAREQLKVLDQELKQQAGNPSRDAVRQKLEGRNALVRQINELGTKARSTTEAFNALVKRTQQELELNRKQVMDTQASVNGRLAAFEAFSKSGQDTAFFVGLNRLLAEIRQGLRENPGNQGLSALLVQVRGLRWELAAWAMAGQSLKSNGLVIVGATVMDEPCWFVVDTGAMDTIVSEEILDAIGQGANRSKITSLSVVGGLRVIGLACQIPRLMVAGQTMANVPASAVSPLDVGIDGLLGQSFLKGFVYTIDERNPAKLILQPK